MKELDLSSLYEIPWTTFNNANGWIEPTTHCQLKCPGCYRGLTQEGHIPRHEEMADLKSQVDFLVEKRNVQAISIAGGEPLLYPYLDELVAYIHHTGVFPIILTNGVLLDEDRLCRLKKSGAGRVVIHVDRFQQRPGGQDEMTVNNLRAEYCDLFRSAKGVQMGFIMPISTDSCKDLNILAPFMIDNADIIDTIIFTIYRENLALQNNHCAETEIDPIISAVRSAFHLEYCAFIPKLHTQDIGWLYGIPLYRNGRPWGGISAGAFESEQKRPFQSPRKTPLYPHRGCCCRGI